MKKILMFIIIISLSLSIFGQTYYPFPTGNAQWNCLTKAQWSPVDIFYDNSQYEIHGDTNIENNLYKKVYYNEVDNVTPFSEYIGGLREDMNKNIYFFPSKKHFSNYCVTQFPSDTTEYLLYSFDSLIIGMILPINTSNNTIKIIGIDSILFGNNYRKRYTVQNSNLFGYDFWIEGIGSTKDLFASFSSEFEWHLYTLCFTDSITYYINSPNGQDSCHYQVPLGLDEKKTIETAIFPNPADVTISIEVENKKGNVNIYNGFGQIVMKDIEVESKVNLNVSGLISGIYFVEFICNENKYYKKFIKK